MPTSAPTRSRCIRAPVSQGPLTWRKRAATSASPALGFQEAVDRRVAGAVTPTRLSVPIHPLPSCAIPALLSRAIERASGHTMRIPAYYGQAGLRMAPPCGLAASQAQYVPAPSRAGPPRHQPDRAACMNGRQAHRPSCCPAGARHCGSLTWWAASDSVAWRRWDSP